MVEFVPKKIVVPWKSSLDIISLLPPLLCMLHSGNILQKSSMRFIQTPDIYSFSEYDIKLIQSMYKPLKQWLCSIPKDWAHIFQWKTRCKFGNFLPIDAKASTQSQCMTQPAKKKKRPESIYDKTWKITRPTPYSPLRLLIHDQYIKHSSILDKFQKYFITQNELKS